MDNLCNESFLETNRHYEKSITVENQKLFCACGKKLSIKHNKYERCKKRDNIWKKVCVK